MALKSLSSRAIIGYILQQLDTPSNSWVDTVSREFKSDQAYEEYRGRTSSAPVMREWVGGRKFDTLRDAGFIIRNKYWEAGLEVQVEDIRRDKTGQVEEGILELAQRAQDHWAQLLSQLTLLGASTACYDGQYFFSTSHQEGNGPTQSNLLTADITSPAAPTVAEMESTILDTTQAFFALKDDQGEPINASAKQFLIQVPLQYMKPVAAALNTSVILEGGQSRNNLIGAMSTLGGFSYEVVVNPRLTGNKLWMYRKDGARKPLIRQVEEPLKVDAIAEGSEYEKLNRTHLYMVSRTGNVGFGDWKGAIQVNFT